MNTIENYAGLEYVTLATNKRSIPVDILLKIEQDIAKHIVKKRPLRGKEILFLRKWLKLSYMKLAVSTDGAYDSSTFSNWEKKTEERLTPSNEMFMRVFFAERLGVKMNAESGVLLPKDGGKTYELVA